MTIRDNMFFEEMTRLNNEMINLQRELSARNAELHRMSELKNQFLGTAAHDLRSPLSIIAGYCELLMSGIAGDLNDEQSSFIKIIRDRSIFMEELVSALLDISAIESGKLTLRRQETDFPQFLRENLALNSFFAERKGIRIRFFQEGEFRKVSLDISKVEQVMNNLISNAVKFSEPGSELHVRAEMKEKEVLVSVEDQGTGIAPEDLEMLFQPFRQLHAPGTEKEKGTGLGLYIARKIIESHGGSIRVTSETGKGSVFTFSIPMVCAPKKEGPANER